jgi:diguanylate cyclase (GGDEF)-like protein/PAS domain S-box-containing protein
MKTDTFQWHSLKTRVTLFTLLMFLISIWSLAWYANDMLRVDMEHQLGEKQFATVSLMAEQINTELTERIDALKIVATEITPATLGDPAALQVQLESRPIFQRLFSGGTIVLNTEGTAIAEVPLSAQRIGLNYLELDTVVTALKANKTIVGRPLPSKTLHAPVFGMAAPIHDAQGRVIGALAGMINLGKPSFLDRISENRYGKTGGYLLIAPQHKLFVTATDKSRIMQPIPAPGITPLFDRYMAGYEGHGMSVSSRGVEELTAVKGIPVAGWYMALVLPTAEAFAPIRALQQRMLMAVTLLSLLAGGLTWWLTAWMLRRQLAPMLTATRTLATLSVSDQPLHALPIARQDEIGELIGGFNHLLQTLAQRQEALKESESRFRALADNASALVWIADVNKLIYYFNNVWLEFTGRSLAQEAGNGWIESIHPDDVQHCMATYVSTFEARQTFSMDYRLRRFDGVYRWMAEHGAPRYNEQGVFLGFIGTCVDITERKQAEEQLNLSASVFTHAREGIMITAADGAIIDVNEAFTRITGYARDDVLGRNPRILSSGRQDAEFYATMWRGLLEHGHWYGEIWNRRKNGEVYAGMQTISAVCNEQGKTHHYVALFSDITTLKTHEIELEHIAHFDTLTGLPNRSLLADRLHQAIVQSQRRGQRLAVAFLDLDGFKAVNDNHGHEAGDQLLMAVAQRMKLTLREGDTLARIGGDEFVAVLLDLADIDACVPMLKRLLDAAAQPVPFGDVMLQVSASLGVTFYPQAEDMEADQLLRQADQAMYQAKLAGKNRYHVFDAAQEHSARLASAAVLDQITESPTV